MVDRIYLGVNKITVNVSDETNILDVDIWAITEDFNEDLIKIRFTPNTVEGVGAKQWAKGWLIKVVHDGYSDVWDPYIKQDVVNVVLPHFTVVFDIVKDALDDVTEIWTFEADECWVANRGDIAISKEEDQGEGVVYVVCIGTVAVTRA